MSTPHLVAAACTSADPEAGYRHAELAVWEELQRGRASQPRPWLSLEEGAMVLAGALDELWDTIRGHQVGLGRAKAAQVGVASLRFCADLYEATGSVRERDRAAAGAAFALRSAVGPQGRMLSSGHEGFGFLSREYEALWSAVRFDDPGLTPAGRVAAMSVRFVAEISSGPAPLVVAS